MSRRHLSLRPEWEEAIRRRRKTIDARVLADEMPELVVGAVLHYPGARARIRAVRYYANFADLLAAEDWRRIAPDARSREETLRLLEEGLGDAARHKGVVAIEIEPLAHEPPGGPHPQ
ncbi:MAG TPA: ASCH domain-containing protein [Vicinamibacterales bacterium]|nr:ASCH domain-containing protein [Vicinamibacterales bacterium]